MVLSRNESAPAGAHSISVSDVSTGGPLFSCTLRKRGFPASSIDWIEVRYPGATVSWLGLNFSWVIWLLLFSWFTVLILRRRFGVTL
jgi:hypothetical protein